MKETLAKLADRNEAAERLVKVLQAQVDVEESFRELFRLYYRPLLVFFHRRGVTAEECEDFTQESLFRVFRGLSAFRREVSFEHWLFQIATNVFRSAVERRATAKRRARVVSLDTDAEAHRLDARVGEEGQAHDHLPGPTLAKEPLAALREAIAELPDQMRRCLLLRIGEELKYREIAETLQISIQTVKTHLARGRARLRERLRIVLPGAFVENEE